jgi:diguanylate cyclase (GGDEF)-like protein/PAS domain S-box-containing protein
MQNMVEEFYKNLLNNLSDGVYFVDPQRKITFWNSGAEKITGYSREMVENRFCHDNILNHVDQEGNLLCHSGCPLAACLEDGEPRESSLYLLNAAGHRVPIRMRVTPIYDENNLIVGAVESFNTENEMVDLRQQNADLREVSRTDPLTGISNRRHLEGRLKSIFLEYPDHQPIAGLVFMDIDHFKDINDRFGHEAGDKALYLVASTLYANIRKTDLVGRWGGEEFLMLLYDVASDEELTTLVEKFRMLVEQSFLEMEGERLRITISCGATRFKAGDTTETILRRIDSLMYTSKKEGRNRTTIG